MYNARRGHFAAGKVKKMYFFFEIIEEKAKINGKTEIALCT